MRDDEPFRFLLIIRINGVDRKERSPPGLNKGTPQVFAQDAQQGYLQPVILDLVHFFKHLTVYQDKVEAAGREARHRKAMDQGIIEVGKRLLQVFFTCRLKQIYHLIAMEKDAGAELIISFLQVNQLQDVLGRSESSKK